MNTLEIREQLFQLTAKGKVKTKGRYEVLPFEKLGFHKNHSAMVIPMAALYHLLGMGDYEEFIKIHRDPFDFMLRVKVPRSSRLVLVTSDGDEQPLQNICRYYPSKKGGKLVKIMPPLEEGGPERRLSVDAEWDVLPCNNMKDFKWDIDYNYYLTEAKKLIDGVS